MMVPLGFVSVKLTYWGLAIVTAISGSYTMLESKDAADVWATGFDTTLNIWTFAPRVIDSMITHGAQSGDPMTLIIYSLVGILPIIPYGVGVALGLLYYPDLWWAGFIWGLIFRSVV
ncbi:hypothetical protein [Salinarchaeum chitinilyticum]